MTRSALAGALGLLLAACRGAGASEEAADSFADLASLTQETSEAQPAGGAAPDFTTTLADGSTFTLSAARGRPVLLLFWAEWCVICGREIPEIDQVAATWGDQVPVSSSLEKRTAGASLVGCSQSPCGRRWNGCVLLPTGGTTASTRSASTSSRRDAAPIPRAARVVAGARARAGQPPRPISPSNERIPVVHAPHRSQVRTMPISARSSRSSSTSGLPVTSGS